MNSVQDYIESLSGDRKEAFLELRQIILNQLPDGFEECMSYGMIGFVVPHKLYPKGYHCTPALPLPFINMVMRKDIVTLYHMGLYADPVLMNWFQTKYNEGNFGKLDMGKSCIRFKKTAQIPFALIGELAQKISVTQWIQSYEKAFLKK